MSSTQKVAIVTGASRGIGEALVTAALDRLHPVGRMGEIGEVVEAIVYLEQARFVTGEILHVDGGQSAGH